MTYRRIALVALLVLCIAVPAAAKTKIVVWHSLDATHGEPMFNRVTDAFRKEYPDIEV